MNITLGGITRAVGIVMGVALLGGVIVDSTIQNARNAKTVETVAPLIKELDTDRNGELSPDEVQKGLEELGKARKLRSEMK